MCHVCHLSPPPPPPLIFVKHHNLRLIRLKLLRKLIVDKISEFDLIRDHAFESIIRYLFFSLVFAHPKFSLQFVVCLNLLFFIHIYSQYISLKSYMRKDVKEYNIYYVQVNFVIHFHSLKL